jgi:hypothetical protein
MEGLFGLPALANCGASRVSLSVKFGTMAAVDLKQSERSVDTHFTKQAHGLIMDTQRAEHRRHDTVGR